jgi:S1-C subfamily serine protease
MVRRNELANGIAGKTREPCLTPLAFMVNRISLTNRMQVSIWLISAGLKGMGLPRQGWGRGVPAGKNATASPLGTVPSKPTAFSASATLTRLAGRSIEWLTDVATGDTGDEGDIPANMVNRPHWTTTLSRCCHLATLAAVIVLGAVSGTAAGATTDTDIVACYDKARKVVSHTLSQACTGEVVSPRREHELEMAERRRVQSAVDSRTLPDPVTGKRRLTGTGSGFYIGQGGEILTNDHVVKRCNMLTVTADDDAKHAAVLVATSAAADIALLRAARLPTSIARFSTAPQASNGEQLAVIGYPAYGLPMRLSSLTPAQTDPATLATPDGKVFFHSEIRHGNSGSPLVDEAGNVVGLVDAMIDTPKLFHATGRMITATGIAISHSALLRFLAAKGITPLFAEGPRVALGVEALHEMSRGFVVQIGCWN